jgi:tetratricopeptide (TPR) repeat protein
MLIYLRKIRRSPTQLAALLILTLTLSLLSAPGARAQGDDDGEVDPVKLFERGQTAHARGDMARALEFYEQAIKVRPEFPEAEFQRGSALVSLGRLTEAEAAFRRSIELKKNWALPYASLGALLARNNRDKTKGDQEAEGLLRQAIKLEAQNVLALSTLAEVRLRAGDAKEAADLAKRATTESGATASTWVLRAMAERALGENAAAKTSVDQALQIDPENVAALVERADQRNAEADYDHAIEDLKAAELKKPGDRQILSRLFDVYERAGKHEEASRVAETLGLKKTPSTDSTQGGIKVVGTPEEIAAANDADPTKARPALEALLKKNPQNAMLLAQLGISYRTEDPVRSLDYFRRANEIEPKNSDYATGYAAALVQSRRFGEAANILHQVVAAAPGSYVAHANLATALYELKNYAEALPEYEWLLKAKPEVVVSYYFIATAHDKLGEYEDALMAYEQFLAHADATVNQLEIEKVRLRLPSLRNQIRLKQGVKRKQSAVSNRQSAGSLASGLAPRFAITSDNRRRTTDDE